jgi:hypothetical protein
LKDPKSAKEARLEHTRPLLYKIDRMNDNLKSGILSIQPPLHGFSMRDFLTRDCHLSEPEKRPKLRAVDEVAITMKIGSVERSYTTHIPRNTISNILWGVTNKKFCFIAHLPR